MLSRAITRPSHFPPRATKGLHRIVAAGVAVAGALGAGQYAKAEKFVDPSMSYQTVNSVIASATAGENVYFDCGTYQLPLQQGASYVVNNGANLRGDCPDGEVVLRGPEGSTSTAILRTSSTGNTIDGLVFENAKLGIFADNDFSPSNPINITNNTLRSLDRAIQWTNKIVSGDNSLPSIKIMNNTLEAIPETRVRGIAQAEACGSVSILG